MASWHADGATVIPLTENFRSRQAILNFVNALFKPLMRGELGGVDYDVDAELVFGAAAERSPLAARPNSPAARLLLRVKTPTDPDADEEEANEPTLLEMGEDEKEARIVAQELLSLKTQGHPVWDDTAKSFRPVEWADMAVLLRAPSGKTESYAREFARLNIPLLVARTRFYESIEILDLLNLLKLLDNPLQDLPLLAVLRSPLVGLSTNELATIRLAATNCRFWVALEHWHKANVGRAASETKDLLEKVSGFLERYAEWRRLARQESLCRCLETILEQSQYEVWLAAQPHGRQGLANVQRLLSLAQEFDRFQRQGLFRFLRFIEAQQQAIADPAAFGRSNARFRTRPMRSRTSAWASASRAWVRSGGSSWLSVSIRPTLVSVWPISSCSSRAIRWRWLSKILRPGNALPRAAVATSSHNCAHLRANH